MSRIALRVILSLMLIVVAACPQPRAETDPAREAAERVLARARGEAERDCSQPSDMLVRVICRQQLRVGLRTYYPGFSLREPNGEFVGFEVDIARRIAEFLGVRMVPVAVDPKTRIPMVASKDIDLLIATTGHNLQRDAEVRFIRPHYYESQTVVVGPRDEKVSDWDDLSGRTVCLPVGSSSNILFIRHHIRILTFDQPEQLLDALTFKECTFVVHDDTFFASLLADPRWSSRFGVKFGFAPLPWGMAVARDDADQFAALLDSLSIAFHAEGVFLELARDNHVNLAFLRDEQRRWSSPGCVNLDGTAVPSCLLPPVDTSDASDVSGLAAPARWIEQHVADWSGMQLDLSLLKHRSGVELLLNGIGYSLALVTGALLSTAAFAFAFAGLLRSAHAPIRRLGFALTGIGQNSPMPLLLFFGYVIAAGVTQYTGTVALLTAIVVLGVYNGANAGRAINEAYLATRRGRTARDGESFLSTISIAGVQLVAFLINAAKGSPAAGMIGVPEFLNVITDLTAYSHDRILVYLVLLIFYTALVLVVIAGLSRAEARLATVMARRP